MAGIDWISTNKFDGPGMTSPAVSLNNNGVMLASYTSTGIPQPFYRSGKIGTDDPFPGTHITIQDAPTDGPERLGYNNAIAIGEDHRFLSITQHLVPSGRLTYVSGTNDAIGTIKFDNHAVLGANDTFSHPSVGLISANRAIVAGTLYAKLGTQRTVHMAELTSTNGVWAATGAQTDFEGADDVALATNANNVGVRVYDSRNVGSAIFLNVGNVSSGVGDWTLNEPIDPPPTGFAKVRVALNDNGLCAVTKAIDGLIYVRLANATATSFSWATPDLAVPPQYYRTDTTPNNFEAPREVSVAINNGYIVLNATTWAQRTNQFREYFILGALAA